MAAEGKPLFRDHTAAADAAPQHTQTLCRNLRALEPVAAAATTSAPSPPFPKLGLSLAFLLLMAPPVPEGASEEELVALADAFAWEVRQRTEELLKEGHARRSGARRRTSPYSTERRRAT